MRGIRVENRRIIYFGNPAGHIAGNQVVVGPIFRGKELEPYLGRQGRIEIMVWKGGVYSRLVNGQVEAQGCESLKSCRVWRLESGVNTRMKFIGYNMLTERFGGPDPQNYHVIYGGEVETNELERIYRKFDGGQEVPGYMGHSLSVSDAIELYNEEAGKLYYVDYRDFKQVAFRGPKPVRSLMSQLQ